MSNQDFVRLRQEVGGTRWMLVARNGRVLAQSAGLFGGVTPAVVALAEVAKLASHSDLTPVLRHPRSSVAWTWAALDAAGVAAASGVRTYERYGTCMTAFHRFVGVVATMTDIPGAIAE